MKTLATAITATLFAAGAGATDVYHGLENGNLDLSTQRVSAEEYAGAQPSIGDSVARYQGWADGNPDLFKADRNGPSGAGTDPDIYRGLGGNPDLRF